ncbi:MAG: electron transfer flavoprotein subunit alpha [Archaeoglobus sp.]|jgi:electron transfer flavoprotein beta subunit|nr:MAG: electron transfer flavoprotein subunit alpha [Archaeoglobus sp.]
MKVCVLLRLVPDLVEELEISENEVVPFQYIPNERDEHAIEEAIVLKEKLKDVTLDVVGIADPDSADEIDEGLGFAAAKGADKLYKVILNRQTFSRVEIAKALADFLNDRGYSLILTGVQAIDSFAGSLGGALARFLNLPYIGGAVELNLNEKLYVKKELEGGISAEYRLPLPAVVGVLSAERPLSFVPFTKLRQAMKRAEIEEVELEVPKISGVELVRYETPPEPDVLMLEGDVEEVADRIVEVLRDISVI